MFILYVQINSDILVMTFNKESECLNFVKNSKASYYKCLPLNQAKDTTFLSCLEWSSAKNDFVVNINKAKEIILNHIRSIRSSFFSKLDIEYMKSMENNNQERMTQIASLKQRLRDVTLIDLPNNTEDLKKFEPAIFLELKQLDI